MTGTSPSVHSTQATEKAAGNPREQELRALVAPIAEELEQSSIELNRDLDCDSEAVREVAAHARRYRGKRLRAAVVLLTARASGKLQPEHIQIAAIVEMIHMATLVHDDVLDRADVRRRVPTANAKFGNCTAVLLGDWIYARAFAMSTKMSDQTCSRVLAEVTATVCRGEIEQSRAKCDFALSPERYIQMIDAKTASLYAASAELGARYSGAPEASVQNAREFGRNLGLAFQIVDDCLDLDGAEDVVGKSLGTDIAEGKITIPMIAMLEGRGESGRARMAAIFEAARETSLNGACNDGARMDRLGVVPVDVESASERARTPLAPSAALKLLASEFDLARALEKSYGVAQSYVQSALDRLYTFPPSPARECLASMAKYVVRRRW